MNDPQQKGAPPFAIRRKHLQSSALSVKKYAVGAMVVALLGAAAFVNMPDGGFSMTAQAQSAGAGQGGPGQGQGGPGEQSGQGNQGGQGQGQGGPSADSEGKGPMAGGPAGNAGGKPVWAQDGIPEVELGRLNVARSPDQVLDRALAEALKSITPDMVAYYNLSLAEAVETLSLDFENVVFIDSPLQNLALLKDLLDGTTVLAGSGVTNHIGTLAAMLRGAASDKTVPISTDTVIAITTILGTPVTEASAASLAAAAEAIRIAILAGHG